ncbi:carboxypeptidase-like regulatory domain-containing protein [Calothrix sp. UHCC 0171]|uniref:carboxypeptidase-like regulatory domain-containing protein n=1 Tax=Calothrix sp. UHCC 0171 TaxID=3110245 RepID=UPI002B206A31|nr:carboxypeptidase-like regulatory domain-containing protein [Calothrix sp. UHCC 0171]MEA5573901.1 carboxypeptidase-like regulatory domain-containing protein [Calothrix sp. UHCC 0171]
MRRLLLLLLLLVPVSVMSVIPKAVAQSTSKSPSDADSQTTLENSRIIPGSSGNNHALQLEVNKNRRKNLINRIKNPSPNLSPTGREALISNSTTQEAVNIAAAKNFTTIPVGLMVGKRNVNFSVLVRGKEDGSQAIDFDNWLIPYDAVIEALRFSVTSLPDGQLELRNSGIVTRIDPRKLANDGEIGLAFSIQDIKKLFGVGATFEINEYAIAFDVPWLNQGRQRGRRKEPPIILEGLPRLQSTGLSLAAVEQRLNFTGGENNSTNSQGDFQAVGSAFGGSWYLRTQQPEFQNSSTWKISEAQFLRQTNQQDYFVGSHPTFWRNQATNGDFWGFTYIQRQGFTPPEYFLGAGSTDPRQRLQSGQIGRTISGRAEPGTLVRLVERFGDVVIAEVLVDSSGVYRFDNVQNEDRYLNSNYRIFLYPEGRLTAQPEIRDASYTATPGQIPAGASAFVASGGFGREFRSNRSLLGDFSDFRGGVAQRWGVSQDLTLGVGGVYDDSFKGLTELFYRPANIPLQVSLSTLVGKNLDTIADIRFEPSQKFNLSFFSDRFSSRLYANWNILRGVSLFANTDSRFGTGGGLQFNFSGRNAYTFARLGIDTENRFRWNLLQRLGKLELRQLGNEVGTLSELTYGLSSRSFAGLGHSLLLNYETRSQNFNSNLLTMGWRYRSQERAIDGNYKWETQLGYGIGSQGTGAIASVTTTVLPGILLRARYQGVSVVSDASSFNIDLVSSLGLQGGISPGDRRTSYYRTQGGMLIQPFLDANNNGKRDSGEEIYTEDANALVIINNRPLKILQPNMQRDRILVRLNPGSYRLDLDPAGFPLDWQAATDAYAVDITAGSYTPVLLPLTRAYAVSGVITNIKGEPINGARVEAVTSDGKKRLFSVTNGAGVYYLERLQQGEYNLLINGKSVNGMKLELDSSSAGLKELNLQQTENEEFRALKSGVNQSVLPKE